MIQVINKVAAILETIAAGGGEKIPLREIAGSVGLNRATCANLLQSLKDIGFVSQEDQRKGYSIGSRLISIVQGGSAPKELLTFSFPLIDKLRDRIDENVILSIIKEDKREVIYTAVGIHELRATTPKIMSAYRASTGRVILAHQDEPYLKNFFERVGPPSEDDWPQVHSFEDLKKELSIIRKSQCYSTVNQNYISSMAVPIFRRGAIMASLGFYLPQIRMQQKGEGFFRDPLLETAQIINTKLL